MLLQKERQLVNGQLHKTHKKEIKLDFYVSLRMIFPLSDLETYFADIFR